MMKGIIPIYVIELSFLILIVCVYAAPTPTRMRPINPEESGNLFEGDMMIPMEERGVLKRGTSVRWPNGVVPYVLSSGFDANKQGVIIDTMRRLESLVAVNGQQCIQFRPRQPSDEYYITIQTGQGCWSNVGRNTGASTERTVNLEIPGCINTGIIMHEFLHTLGFFHEQSRPDRDSHVRVNYENIQSGMEHNFQKYDNTVVDTQNTDYDYGSVMHYPRNAFSKNGSPTIEPIESDAAIGQRNSLSTIDIQEVRLFYGCSTTGTSTTTTSSLISSTYPIQLTSNSPVFTRPNANSGRYYHVPIEVIVGTSGTYTFETTSTMDTYGCIYNAFSSSSPNSNLLKCDDDSGGNQQLEITTSLQSTGRIIIVITTYTAGTTGNATLKVVGPGIVTFIPLSMGTTTVRPTTTITTTVRPTTTITTTVRPTTTITTAVRPTTTIINTGISTYSNQLTYGSPNFYRPGGQSNDYYYQAILVTVTISGSYTFISNSNIDSYGILYAGRFSASQPYTNILTQNDDSAGNQQFKLINTLTANYPYTLVFTTYDTDNFGRFSITASGPGNVNFMYLTN